MSAPIPALDATLRRLFLTLYLRGRSSRGLKKDAAPKSVAAKLWLTLAVYAFVGMMAIGFYSQGLFVLSAALHAMTFMFLGMFVAASGGELLFNAEEADILLHRPIPGRILLRAKVRVLVEVSLWIAGAFNLAGLVMGIIAPGGGWLFLFAHTISVSLEALFCTACVVVTYQLCLRWFGRERLDTLMTTAQVLMAVSIVLAGQIVPRALSSLRHVAIDERWWMNLLPPVWFAALDVALTGHADRRMVLLAAAAVGVTAAVVTAALGKLAADYERGVQTLNESRGQRTPRPGRRRWLDLLVGVPPLRWWLRDSVSRAAFVLTGAYLARDRELKLRLYPSLATMLIVPIIFLFDGRGHGAMTSFKFAFASAFIALTPMAALETVRCSAQWQAADVFRIAPLAGPSPLCHGARRAVVVLLFLPLAAVLVALALFLGATRHELLLLVPGALGAPVYALWGSIGAAGVPLSAPNEPSRAAGRGIRMLLIMLPLFGLAGIATWADQAGWLGRLVAVEAVVVVAAYAITRSRFRQVRWPALD
jgi:ABC-2 type transport system permease protein